MVLSPVSILGGDSVYCINESQMEQAKRLAEEDPESSIKIKSNFFSSNFEIDLYILVDMELQSHMLRDIFYRFRYFRHD